MANICQNTLYLTTRDKTLRDSVKKLIEETFTCNDSKSIDGEVFECKIKFDSRWIFPYKEMEELSKKFAEGNDLHIHVISYEFGCEYVGFNIYAYGEWRDKFAG